jgi:hypothetical protein
MNKTILGILAIALMTTSSSVYAQLTGKVRSDVVSGYQKTCFETQRQGSPNQSMSDVTLKQYCICASEYFADLLNEPLLRDIYAGNVKLNPEWNELAAQYCRKNYAKY